MDNFKRCVDIFDWFDDNITNEGIKHTSAADQARFNYELGNAYFGKGDSAGACEAYGNASTGDYAEAAKYQMEHVVKCE